MTIFRTTLGVCDDEILGHTPACLGRGMPDRGYHLVDSLACRPCHNGRMELYRHTLVPCPDLVLARIGSSDGQPPVATLLIRSTSGCVIRACGLSDLPLHS